MLSMPPATTISAPPAASASWAIITAFMPEPHILLTVVAPTLSGQSGAERRLPRRRLALAGRQHAAHDDLVDIAAGEAGALERRRESRGRRVAGRRRP